MSMLSIHSILNKNDWDLTEIKLFLENDASSINNLNLEGLTPLHRVIKDKNSSVNFIRCLLYSGANPNSLGKFNNKNNHPLLLALLHKRDKDVIRLLLDIGSRVRNVFDESGHSALCIALRYDLSGDLVRMLLEAGCSPKKRPNHVSALHCSMTYPGAKLRASICKLLLEKDASFLRQSNSEKRSFMCYALSWDAETEAIEMLMGAGCSLNDCQEHYSALGCAIDHPGLLKTETVQLLLNAGVKAGCVQKNYQYHHYYNNLIKKALEIPNYEVDAIKLLYNCDSDVYPNGWPTAYLLESAVVNLHCKPEILPFLIDQGADITVIDSMGRTPLHLAIENDNCQPAVIEFLLRNRCPANKRYGMHQFTALKDAFDKGRDSSVIVELLKGGARLAAAGNISDILRNALEKYDSEPCEEKINYVKTLLKYALLENPKFDIRVLPLGRKHYSLFSNFNSECMREIKILKSTNIFQFIGRHSDYKPKAKGNQLLKVPSMYTFSVYFDDIRFTYGREAMEMRSRVQPIYCISEGSNLNVGKVILNHDIVIKIAALLSDQDLFSLLVACFNPSKPTYYAKERKPNNKRCSKEPTKHRKRSRRCR